MINQLRPVNKNERVKVNKNLNFEIFLKRLIIKNAATVNPTNNKAAGPFVNKANPKKKTSKNSCFITETSNWVICMLN